MMLSGVSMIIRISLKTLDLTGIGIAGMTLGLSFGLYWSNRGCLALAITNDKNRNYYYGLETFIYTIIAIAISATIGWFIQSKIGDAENSALWVTDDILRQRVSTFIPQYLAIIVNKKIL